MASLDILAVVFVLAVLWGLVGFGIFSRQRTVCFVGVFGNLLFWAYLIIGNVDITWSAVTEGCNTLTGVCTVTTTTTVLLNIVPNSMTNLMGGLFGVLMIAVSLYLAYVFAQ